MHAASKPFLRVLNSISSKDLSNLVSNSSISGWKSVINAIYAFSPDEAALKLYASKLGDRILEAKSGASSSEASTLRKNALLCYVAASNLQRVASIWIPEVSEKESELMRDSLETTAYSARLKALQELMEKITIFRTFAKPDTGSNLDHLNKTYFEYSSILASQGQFDLAEYYLNHLPTSDEVKIEKERVAKANENKTSEAPSFPYATVKSAIGSFAGAKKPSSYVPRIKTSAFQDDTASNNETAVIASNSRPAAHFTSDLYGQHTENPRAALSQDVNLNVSQKIIQSPIAAGSPLVEIPPASSSAPHNQGHVRSASGIYRPSNPIIDTSTYTDPKIGTDKAAPPPPSPDAGKKDSGWNDPPSSTLSHGIRHMGTAPQQAITSPFSNQARPLSPPRFSRTVPDIPPPEAPSVGGNVSQVSAAQSSSTAVNPYAPQVGTSGASADLPGYRASYCHDRQQASGYNTGAAQNPYARPFNGSEPYNATGAHELFPQEHASYKSQQHVLSFGQISGTQREPIPEPPMKEKPRYPSGDRTHIPNEARPIYALLDSNMARIKPLIPPTFKHQAEDIDKRLGILFDHLNNDNLLSAETIGDMVALAYALDAGDFETATAVRLAILTTRVEECGQWMPGVKRLIDMSRVIRV